MADSKLKLEDLNLGMWVYEDQLSDIFGVYITLINSKLENDRIYGKIAFIGKELTKEADAVKSDFGAICAIYNEDNSDVDCEVCYDE